MTPQGPISRLQVFKNKMDDQPTWETYLGTKSLNLYNVYVIFKILMTTVIILTMVLDTCRF